MFYYTCLNVEVPGLVYSAHFFFFNCVYRFFFLAQILQPDRYYCSQKQKQNENGYVLHGSLISRKMVVNYDQCNKSLQLSFYALDIIMQVGSLIC